MEERTRRIVETAIELAERDGFEAVRLRDVAKQAKVALGTVYRRFHSKEDILAAALQMYITSLQDDLKATPPRANTALDRATAYFTAMTEFLVSKPNLARALLRAVSSGVPEVSGRVTRFQGTMTNLVVLALRGATDEACEVPQDRIEDIAYLLQNMWFAEIVGWAGNLNDPQTVVEHTRMAAVLLIDGARSSA